MAALTTHCGVRTIDAKIRYLSPSDLRRAPGCTRKHSDKQITKIAASLRQFGIVLPVIVDTRNRIVHGEAVVEAARRLGIEVPVITLSHLDDASLRVLRLALNRLQDVNRRGILTPPWGLIGVQF